MTELNKMVGTPFEWKIKGKILKVSFATLNHLGEFEAWIIERYKQNMRETANTLPPDEKHIFLLKAMRDVPSGVELARLNSDEMVTIAGSRKFLHILVKDNDPDITEKELFNLITPENLAEAQDIIADMTGLKEDKKDDKKEGSAGEKKKTEITK